mmetsp:Transcript_9862/g.10796  ORF Transcript_9862/g.10796 Transcript_9862/m.10796 type:complete len:169 (-) Transcript_9862:31-537(-)
MADLYLNNPLELLVEIGLNKIEKDYRSWFSQSRVCSSEDLERYNLEFSSLEEKYQIIRKLHSCFELYTLAKIYSLPIDALRMLMRQTFQFYLDHSSENHPVFVIPLKTISTNLLTSTLKAEDFDCWMATFPASHSSNNSQRQLIFTRNWQQKENNVATFVLCEIDSAQ